MLRALALGCLLVLVVGFSGASIWSLDRCLLVLVVGFDGCLLVLIVWIDACWFWWWVSMIAWEFGSVFAGLGGGIG